MAGGLIVTIVAARSGDTNVGTARSGVKVSARYKSFSDESAAENHHRHPPQTLRERLKPHYLDLRYDGADIVLLDNMDEASCGQALRMREAEGKAEDPNQDQIQYQVFYREAGTERWIRIAKELDEKVEEFLKRPIEHPIHYLFVDASYFKVRTDSRYVTKAFLVVMGIRDDGYREILGARIADGEDELWNGGSVGDYNKDGVTDDLDRLQYNDKELKVSRFQPWTKIIHPDYGDAEVGGWNPKFWSQNPPPELLEIWAEKEARSARKGIRSFIGIETHV